MNQVVPSDSDRELARRVLLIALAPVVNYYPSKPEAEIDRIAAAIAEHFATERDNAAEDRERIEYRSNSICNIQDSNREFLTPTEADYELAHELDCTAEKFANHYAPERAAHKAEIERLKTQLVVWANSEVGGLRAEIERLKASLSTALEQADLADEGAEQTRVECEARIGLHERGKENLRSELRELRHALATTREALSEAVGTCGRQGAEINRLREALEAIGSHDYYYMIGIISAALREKKESEATHANP